MMKFYNKKIGIIAVSAVLATACISAGIGLTVGKPASAELVAPEHFKENYYKDEEILLSGRKVVYDGKEYDASVTLIAPDGNGYVADSYRLSQAGTYTVEYRFKVDGKTFSTSETFTVLQNLYDVTTSRSSVEYTTYTDTVGEDSVTSEGLLVNLASGDEFTYNKIIDLSDNTVDDKLLGLFVIPQKKGAADLYKIDVTFTDIYDESNYVTVTFKTGEKSTENLISGKHYYEYTSYMSANAAQQLTTGIDRNDKGTFEYQGKLYYKWVSHAQYGYMFRTSFYGTDATVKYLVDQATGTVMDKWLEYTPTGAREMEIYFDYANRQIHGSDTTPNPSTLVCDLDDSAFFGDLWKGFTTGEVKMSIRGGNYVSAAATFMITGIDGDELASKTLTDTTPPQIEIDFQGYEKDALPTAKKGLPYPIFPANAVDNYDGNVETVTNVYYNYNSNNQINVEVMDGAFVPAYEGRYALVYVSSDSSGNQSKRILWVEAESGLSLGLNVEDEFSTALVGKTVNLPAYVLNGFSGNAVCGIVA
ncbi:MAG: hypothetical protein IJB97_00140, partial [Clostridia bacterium]|nr:hypothetical protein [Clostridia bacterium]